MELQFTCIVSLAVGYGLPLSVHQPNAPPFEGRHVTPSEESQGYSMGLRCAVPMMISVLRSSLILVHSATL